MLQKNDVKNSITLPKQRIDSLQALRALAFMGIFVGHSGIGGLGAWGVSVFIVLSGFLMTYTYWDRQIDGSFRGSIKFGVKKIKKLYPLHIIVLFVFSGSTLAGLAKNFSLAAAADYLKGLVPSLLLVQSLIPNSEYYYAINGVAWYLSTCMFLYMAFPFVLKQIKKLKSAKGALWAMAVIFAVQTVLSFAATKVNLPAEISDNFVHWACYISPFMRIGDFAVGCCLGYIFLNRQKSLGFGKSTVAEIAVLAAFAASHMLHLASPNGDWWRLAIVYLPTSAALVWLFAEGKGLVTKLLNNKAMLFIGNISPYTFLVHNKIIGAMQVYVYLTLQKNISVVQLVFINFGITVAVAVAYMWAEKLAGRIAAKTEKTA